MKIIVPMAGMGKRMRPHTLTVPKPLIPIAGKPIVQHLVEDLAKISDEKVDEIGFVIGRFGEAVEKHLVGIAEALGAKGRIFYQDEALGTAHAIYMAADMLSGPVIVAFADTLFRASLNLNSKNDGIIWVKEIEDPRAFGVVEIDQNDTIINYHEKPDEPVSNLAMIGIYFFRQSEELKKEIEYLLDNNVLKGGEYQLPDAMRRLTERGLKLQPGKVDEWLDCGNKDVTVQTNNRVLAFKEISSKSAENLTNENSVIIEPCWIGKGVRLLNSVVGPHVSIGDGTTIENSRVSASVIQKEAHISNAVITNSMVGASAEVKSNALDLSVSDYTKLKL